MKKVRDIKWNFKLSIILVLSIILLSIITVGIVNRDNIMSILGNRMKSEEQPLEFLSYKIYDNKDSQHIKIIVTINSETGIEYVKKSDGTIVQANNKAILGLDYIMAVNTAEPIIVKEVGKEEKTENIIIEEAGNEQNPLIIKTAKQLQDIQRDTDKLFKDDVLRSEVYYKIGANIDLADVEWIPIGTKEKPFEGILDGNKDEYIISNFTYEDSEKEDAGLFGYSTGTLKNIKLDHCEVTGKTNVGVLVGNNTGIVSNIEITNTRVNGTTNTGILVGYSSGTSSVNKNTIQGEVVVAGENAGGLVGYNDGIISKNTINVTVSGVTNVGGIVGLTNNEVTNNTVSGTINATGNGCGGIAGYAWSNVTGNTSSANISGIENVGGCVGDMSSSAYRNFVCKENISTGNVEGKVNVGGIVGYAHIYVDGHGSSGYLTVSKCYSTSRIVAIENYVGGIVGNVYVRAKGSMYNGYATINVENSFALGSVAGQSYCGGVVGYLVVSESSRGRGYTNIINNYVTCSVSGTGDNIEPLLGKFDKYINNGSYTISEYNYFAPEKTGVTSSIYGTSKTLLKMFRQSEFANWDFDNIWTIEEGITLPYLRDMPKPDVVDKESAAINDGTNIEISPDFKKVVIKYKNIFEIASATINGENMEISQDEDGYYIFSKQVSDNASYEVIVTGVAGKVERKEYANLMDNGINIDIFKNVEDLGVDLQAYGITPNQNGNEYTEFIPGKMQGGHATGKTYWEATFDWNCSERLSNIKEAEELFVEFYLNASGGTENSHVAGSVTINYADGTQKMEETPRNYAQGEQDKVPLNIKLENKPISNIIFKLDGYDGWGSDSSGYIRKIQFRNAKLK